MGQGVEMKDEIPLTLSPHVIFDQLELQKYIYIYIYIYIYAS